MGCGASSKPYEEPKKNAESVRSQQEKSEGNGADATTAVKPDKKPTQQISEPLGVSASTGVSPAVSSGVSDLKGASEAVAPGDSANRSVEVSAANPSSASEEPDAGKRPTRVLVTGASGLLGREVMKEIQGDTWKVRGLYASRPGKDLVQCNLLEASELETQFVEFAPDVVIHAAAERRPDVVFNKPEAAKHLNIDVTANIASACKRHNAWLVFISTDYVFNGECPPYTTDAKPQPLSTYGEQKVDGENLCSETCPTSAVLRIPLLYGNMEYPAESGVTILYDQLQKKIKMADHLQKRYPTYTVDVAKILHKMLEVQFAGGQQLTGVYHWQAEECLTKYDMLQSIATIVEIDASQVEASSTVAPFPVPMDTHLDSSRLETALSIDAAKYRTAFKEAVGECFKQYFKAKDNSGKEEQDMSDLDPCTSTVNVPLEEAERVLVALGATQQLRGHARRASTEGNLTQKEFEMLLGAQCN